MKVRLKHKRPAKAPFRSAKAGHQSVQERAFAARLVDLDVVQISEYVANDIVTCDAHFGQLSIGFSLQRFDTINA